MDTTLIVIDSDAELARACALVDRLMVSDDPADLARLAAQARLIAAYEEPSGRGRGRARPRSSATSWISMASPSRPGAASRHPEPRERDPARPEGTEHDMVQRLRARFRVPAELLLPPPKLPRRRSSKRAA
jgi:HTH-type transcriptional regulator/antitoxin HigA